MTSQPSSISTGQRPDTAAHRPANRWLTIVRVAWFGLTLLTLGLFLAGIPAHFNKLADTADKRSLLELGLSAAGYAVYVIGLKLIVLLAHHVIAAVIFWRRSDEWMTLFVSFALVTNGATVPLATMYAPNLAAPPWGFLVAVVTYLGLVSSVTLPYLFPNGQFVPRWTHPLAISWALLTLWAVFWPNSPFSLQSWPVLLQILVLLIWPGAGVFAQIYRYQNVSSLAQRQQTKWALLGLTAAVLGPFAYYFLPFVILPPLNSPAVPNILYQRIGVSFFSFSLLFRLGGLTVTTFFLLLFPLSFAIAILRYRLWDIDLFINRTLVYGILTGLLALIYVSSVVLLQSLFRVLMGQESQLAIVASTLGIAALFNPLRQHVQTLIDRRFYRHKYDLAQTLAAFSVAMRDEVDLDRLTEALAAVVKETVQPASISVWLREPEHENPS
jgi:hypothetical protein